jgi:gluconolactonase
VRARCLLVASALSGLGCSEKSAEPGPVETTTAGSAGQASSGFGGAPLTGPGGVPLGGSGAAATNMAGAAGALVAAGGGGAAGDSPGSEGPTTLGQLYCPETTEPYPNPLAESRVPVIVPIAPPGGISFLEGPVWLADRGVLLLSEWNDQHRILQLTPPQAVEIYKPMSRTNGLVVTADGKSLLVVTEMPDTTVSRVDLTDKSVEPLVEDYEGESFIQPNDLTVLADGTLFFTDYQAGRLYERDSAGKVSLISSLAHANGVGISPDEKTLYLMADTHAVRYPLGPGGSVGMEAEFAANLNGADGLAIDCAGNVYIAENNGGALVVLAPGGNKLGELTGLPKTVTNAAFGGPERKTLYITTSSALYAVSMPIAGLPY